MYVCMHECIQAWTYSHIRTCEVHECIHAWIYSHIRSCEMPRCENAHVHGRGERRQWARPSAGSRGRLSCKYFWHQRKMSPWHGACRLAFMGRPPTWTRRCWGPAAPLLCLKMSINEQCAVAKLRGADDGVFVGHGEMAHHQHVTKAEEGPNWTCFDVFVFRRCACQKQAIK